MNTNSRAIVRGRRVSICSIRWCGLSLNIPMPPKHTESLRDILTSVRVFALLARFRATALPAASASTLLLLAVALLCGCGEQSTTEPEPGRQDQNALHSDPQVVLADLERLTKAFYSDDLNTILALTHPNVIEQMGGPAQAKSLLKNSLERIQASGVSIESCTFPESPKFTEGANHQFVVVPMKLVLAARGQRRESVHCQVGVRAPGATNWTYIEGSQVRVFFPDFPSNVALPEVKGKAL
jgi:hypothetical protein